MPNWAPQMGTWNIQVPQYPQGTSSGAPIDEKRAAEVKASEKQIKAMLGRMLPGFSSSNIPEKSPKTRNFWKSPELLFPQKTRNIQNMQEWRGKDIIDFRRSWAGLKNLELP